MSNTLKQHGFPVTVRRLFTRAGYDAYDLIHFRDTGRSALSECPAHWSDEAALLLADEAACNHAPNSLSPIEENTVPSWLWRHTRHGSASARETTAQAIFNRVVGAATYNGWQHGVFADETTARPFYDEARYALAQGFIAIDPRNLAALGLGWAYGITPSSAAAITPSTTPALDIGNSMIDAIVGGTRDSQLRARWHKATNTKHETSVTLRFADIAADWGTSAAAPMRAAIDVMGCRHNDGSINIDALRQATRLLVLLLDLNDVSDDHLGIGVSNLSSLLMALALPYDSDAARTTAAAISAIVTAEAITVSAELAALRGMSAGFTAHRDITLRALRNHRRAAYGEHNDYEKISVVPVALTLESCPDLALAAAARDLWDDALQLAQNYGLRCRATTTLTPSPRLTLLTGCSTQGITPVSMLTTLDEARNTLVHPSVTEGFMRLGYDRKSSQSLTQHIIGHRSLAKAPGINHMALRARGFDTAALERVEDYLPQVNKLRLAFTPWVVGVGFCRDVLNIAQHDIDNPRFDMLHHLGFSAEAIAAANAWCFGHASLVDAPELNPKHAAIFVRADDLAPDAMLRMASAVQGFVSSEAGLHITLPIHTPVDRVEKIILSAWRQGLKSLTLTYTTTMLAKPAVPQADTALQRIKTARANRTTLFAQTKVAAMPTRKSRTRAATIIARPSGKRPSRTTTSGKQG